MAEIKERAFEEDIECALLRGGPDACPGEGGEVKEDRPAFGDWLPGGYRKKPSATYDPRLCLIPRDTIDFIQATQPKEWERLKQHHGAEVKEKFLKRLAEEVERRGALDVLRQGLKDSGCKFKLVHFKPISRLNEPLQKMYEANLFSVVRQLHYSERYPDKSLDLVIFLNGIPIFTAELKNPFTGQNVEDSISQYRFNRDPREPLLAFRRCLAHFAVDPELLFITTKLEGKNTAFLPFNQGKFGGAGNPPVPPSRRGYPTSFLWERIWARDSVLDLLQHFIHEIEEEDEDGRRTGKLRIIFPRYHQLDAVRRLVNDARKNGPGCQYLIEHSAGSGKSNSIAWLAHQLSVLHDRQDRRVFDSIVVITDRRILDRQLQNTVLQFQQTDGIVENIDRTSRQLKAALETGKTIIVSTLQKFPVVAGEIQELPGKRFAVIVDEAHSSQTGESTKSLKAVLAVSSLEDAEREEGEAGEAEDLEDRIAAEMKKRGRLPNVSFFAFTATPKAKTLELFGTKRADGSFQPFNLYSMRQAIEEGFILDVLENYTTYQAYWRLLKTIKDDPRYDRDKANYLLRLFVDLHPHAVRKKVEIMVEHFRDRSASRIDGQAKAMIVTRSRLHAVRFKLELDAYLNEKGYPYKSLVAFSGQVNDGGRTYSEPGMNGIPEAQTAHVFKKPEYRFLVVAEKFQMGYDMPLLQTMYVDKKLAGLHAVQTLSRLNRVHPGKRETMVLDFVNEADEIRKGFEPYYEKTILSEATDPNRLYDFERELEDFHVYDAAEVQAFAQVYFQPGSRQDRLYAVLEAPLERFKGLAKEDQDRFRTTLTDYVRLYAFLSQVLTFVDVDLEKLYVFSRLLRRLLPWKEDELPREITQKIDIESYRIQRTFKGRIELPRGEGTVSPGGGGGGPLPGEEIEPLSQIIKELNERFGTDFTEEDKVFIRQLEDALAVNIALAASVRANTPENARLSFDHVVNDRLQEMIDSNFKFYKRITDDPQFGKFFVDWLFDRFRKAVERAE